MTGIKTPLMEVYEEETGKLAIWKGELTKDYIKWKTKKDKKEIKKEKIKVLKS